MCAGKPASLSLPRRLRIIRPPPRRGSPPRVTPQVRSNEHCVRFRSSPTGEATPAEIRVRLSRRRCRFGRRWAAPFGIAPIGLGNLIWPRAEEAIARAAAAADIPYTLSTAANTKLERIAEIAPGHAWFQLYVSKRDEDVADIVERAERAGYDVLLLTVDVPLAARRLRDIRNNFMVPFKITPRVALELITHPRWSIETVSAGVPRFVNVEQYAPMVNRQSIAAYLTSEIRGRFDWEDLKKLRARWRRRLVVKGVMTAEA